MSLKGERIRVLKGRAMCFHVLGVKFLIKLYIFVLCMTTCEKDKGRESVFMN